MIHSFKFKNFCSFADESTISFEDSRKSISTKNNMFCDRPSGSRISKVTTVIGPNASGKTNALKALSFLSWFVRNSFVGLEGEKEMIPVDTFSFSDGQKGIAEFEIVFEHKTEIYRYMLHLCKTHVVKEELFGKDKKTNHFNYLFKRLWNPKSESSDIIQRINLRQEVIKEILRRNVSLIAASVAVKNEVLTEIASFWQGIISNVNRTGKVWDTASLGENGLFDAAEFYKKNPTLFEKVVQFLKDIDLGLDGVFIEEVEARHSKTGEIKKVFFPSGVHKVNKKEFRLPFAFESSGTKNMFVLLHFLLPAIEQGGVAVIDELEIDLHPHTLPCIIELFANPATNLKNTQLLFTSHSLEILSHLEKEQVVLVEKNEDCKSELYRLDEIKGVRRDDNIYSKYMAGAYGAVPNI
ncbi:MAG: AAA family ATPase [Candidatus Omnitrophica bacterium]|nr:AAA family ATPase [Candidatus Omnitrophota bacterium]